MPAPTRFIGPDAAGFVLREHKPIRGFRRDKYCLAGETEHCVGLSRVRWSMYTQWKERIPYRVSGGDADRGYLFLSVLAHRDVTKAKKILARFIKENPAGKLDRKFDDVSDPGDMIGLAGVSETAQLGDRGWVGHETTFRGRALYNTKPRRSKVMEFSALMQRGRNTVQVIAFVGGDKPGEKATRLRLVTQSLLAELDRAAVKLD